MRVRGTKGVTLVELLVTLSILGILSTAAAALLSTTLQAYETGTDRSDLYREGMIAMERMTEGVRKSTYVLIPNAHNTTRDILAFSGSGNDDDDYYFDDPLFPRIDEDTKKDMTDDGQAGISGLDDDGDGVIDEGIKNDDDEDGLADEDPIDGIDNDGDGNIDEDKGDGNIPGMDDDGDGQIDEGDSRDDDEDGLVNEDSLDPIIYTLDSGTNTLKETDSTAAQTVDLSTHATAFQVTFEAPQRILIELTLTGDHGEVIQFSEYAFARNVFQWNGKRVR